MALPPGTVFKRFYIGDDGVDTFAGANRPSVYDADVSWGDYKFEGFGSSDTLLGGHGDDLMYGDSGNDTMSGGYGFNSLFGGTGIDTLTYAFFGKNTVYTPSTRGVDVDLAAQEATDIGTVLELEDRIVGFENVIGSNRNDSLYGNSKSNDLEGGSGKDLLSGRDGADFLDGGSNRDKIYGGSGNDDLFGGTSGDYLSGGNGNDDMDGETGADRMFGGLGADDIVGGDGADDFIYRSIAESTVDVSGRDVIRDFSRAELDVIDLEDIDANSLTAADSDFIFIGRDTFSDTAGELRYRFGSNFTVVEADTNGNGVADFAITFADLIDFRSTDFFT